MFYVENTDFVMNGIYKKKKYNLGKNLYIFLKIYLVVKKVNL